MKIGVLVAALAAFLVAAGVTTRAKQGPPPASGDRFTADVLKGLEFRSIGPAIQTGRVQDIAVDPKSPNTWYVATAFGGLWKTTNRGTTFTPVFDDGGTFTLCCVVVDPKDSNIVWLGTGENASQRSAHFGDGLYKSTDAGKTWKRVGLEKSEHIGQILVDPRNSSVVYVAAQGPLFSAGGDRGLYKTADGGATWTAVLHVSDDTGISDIVFDPKNADVIYASAYQRRRAVGQMVGSVREMTGLAERRDLLVKALGRPLATAELRQVFAATAELGSPAEQRDVLVYAAGHQRLDAAARQAFVGTASVLSEAGDRATALAALLDGSPAAASPRAPSATHRSATEIRRGSAEEPGLWSSEMEIDQQGGARVVRIHASRVMRASDGEIRSIRPGGSLLVEEVTRGSTRRVEMAPEGDGIYRTYRVNGAARPYDGEAARWVAALLREFTGK